MASETHLEDIDALIVPHLVLPQREIVGAA